jgi:hypothetical protein
MFNLASFEKKQKEVRVFFFPQLFFLRSLGGGRRKEGGGRKEGGQGEKGRKKGTEVEEFERWRRQKCRSKKEGWLKGG